MTNITFRSDFDVDNHVKLLGYYGGDETHALSAWTSTTRELTDERKDRLPAMLKMLAENDHHTPFEKSMLHFNVNCDTASHIHLIKHRIGVSVNAESARYKEHTEDKFYIPGDWPESEQHSLFDFSSNAFKAYHQTFDNLEAAGISRKRAKESARYYIPYSSKVNIDVSFNFRSFMLFQKLRNDDHAQEEIHNIAKDMLNIVKDLGDFKYSLQGFGHY